MKKYIREMLDDLRRATSKDHIPPVPKPSIGGTVEDLTPPQEPPVREDLENQELSDDPLERARQLDFQAQQSEERQRS